MTNKTTMPEPILVADRRVHGYVGFTAKGRLDFSRYPDGTKFITTDQAEAYADARVREALEQAAVVAERSFCDCCCSDDQKFTAEDAAQSIRALIPKA